MSRAKGAGDWLDDSIDSEVQEDFAADAQPRDENGVTDDMATLAVNPSLLDGILSPSIALGPIAHGSTNFADLEDSAIMLELRAGNMAGFDYLLQKYRRPVRRRSVDIRSRSSMKASMPLERYRRVPSPIRMTGSNGFFLEEWSHTQSLLTFKRRATSSTVRRGPLSAPPASKERKGGFRSEGFIAGRTAGCAGVFSAKCTTGAVSVEGISSPRGLSQVQLLRSIHCCPESRPIPNRLAAIPIWNGCLRPGISNVCYGGVKY